MTARSDTDEVSRVLAEDSEGATYHSFVPPVAPATLIATSRALSAATCDTIAFAWDGPLVILSLPQSETFHGAAGNPQEQVIVDCMEEPESYVQLLCEVVSRLSRFLRDLKGPLLFLAGHHENPRSIIEGLDSPSTIDYQLDSSGQLAVLCLGSEVASNPVMPEFFEIMRDRTADPDTFVDLMRALLVWEPTS